MIIKSKPLPLFLLKLIGRFVSAYCKMRFNKLPISFPEIKPNHSYILQCNHFGFVDGILGFYLVYHALVKQGKADQLYIMSLKKQMEKNPWLRYIGSFSVEPGKISITESFKYAAEVLERPGNVLLFYPQGKLESCHVRTIKFQEGIAEIISRIKGNCQLLWSSNVVEYFESIKPSVYFNMLDCGTNHEFDFNSLQAQVNAFHKESIKQNIRYTADDL